MRHGDCPRNAMTDKRTQQQAGPGNMEKRPEDWVTGDEPMTGAQRSYLKTLSEEAHVDFDDHLTKAEASRRIDELQAQTGRGQPTKPLESLGRAVSETVLGSEAPGQPAPTGSDPPLKPDPTRRGA
jgi:hypothetical protein